MRLLRVFHRLTGAMVAGVIVGGVASQSVRAEDQLVYWPFLTDGTEYRRIPYPYEAGTILVLADTDVVIEARRVSVNYWPITREYLADFSKQPPPVAGKVEIVGESGDVSVVEPTPYVIWHPEGVGAGPVQLLVGEESKTFYSDYVKAARAAAEEAKEYQRLVAERQAAVEDWLRIAAERPPNLPKPPPELDIEEPEPFHAFATEPKRAAVTALPEGPYVVRIRDADGEIIPGSERKLISFAPRARAFGYVLRPEDRWTQPVVSFSPDEVVYTTDKTGMFLQPVPVAEYSASHFARLFRPQSVEAVDPSLSIWTPRPQDSHAMAGAELAMWDEGKPVGTMPQTPYRVVQLPGAARGYEIKEFKAEAGASLQPDFVGMRVDKGSVVERIGLVKDDEILAGSERKIRRVSPVSDAFLFLPALLPLAVGGALHLVRRRRH
jgi:hypothetical protein